MLAQIGTNLTLGPLAISVTVLVKDHETMRRTNERIKETKAARTRTRTVYVLFSTNECYTGTLLAKERIQIISLSIPEKRLYVSSLPKGQF
jgi:hypothetical protein